MLRSALVVLILATVAGTGFTTAEAKPAISPGNPYAYATMSGINYASQEWEKHHKADSAYSTSSGSGRTYHRFHRHR